MLKKKKHTPAVRHAPSRMPARGEDATPASAFLSALICAARGALIACGVGALLLLAVTGIAYAQDDPDAWVKPLGYLVAAVASLTAGAVASHQNRRAVLLCGLLSAAVLLLIFAALSFLPVFADCAPNSLGLSLGLHAALLPLSVLGAYLGRRRGRR